MHFDTESDFNFAGSFMPSSSSVGLPDPNLKDDFRSNNSSLALCIAVIQSAFSYGVLKMGQMDDGLL